MTKPISVLMLWTALVLIDAPEANAQAPSPPEANVQAPSPPEPNVQAPSPPEPNVQAPSPPEPSAQARSRPQNGAFVSIGVGAQPQTRLFTSSNSFPLYDETATITASQRVRRGTLLDVGGGYRMWRRLSIAVGFSAFYERSTAAPAVASIPDPLFVGRAKTVTLPASRVAQTDFALNLQLVWTVPVTDRMDVALFVGPSLIRVKQDVPSATVAAGTQNATASVKTESATTLKAGSAGLNFSYKLTDRYGVDVFVRYAGGEVDLRAVRNLMVGGVQSGAGLRIRF